MFCKTVRHPFVWPSNRIFGRIESHRSTTAACQLRWKWSKVWKLHGFWKRKWLAGSKPRNLWDNLSGVLNLGQKVCRLPWPSPARRRQVRPRIEAFRRSVRDWNVKPHMFWITHVHKKKYIYIYIYIYHSLLWYISYIPQRSTTTCAIVSHKVAC